MKCLIECLLGGLICASSLINFGTFAETSDSSGVQDNQDNVVINEINDSSEKQQVFRDVLTGKFNGIDIDTLIVLPEGEKIRHDSDGWDGEMPAKWRIRAINGTVQDMIVEDTTGVRFIKEGDLDGNGTDEWGYISERYLGTWTCYNVFTCVKGKWKYLVKPIPICINQIIEYNIEDSEWMNPSDTRHYLRVDDIIRPAKKKGYVTTRMCETINEVTEWVVTEKTVKTKKINISDHY